ncbi:hypothetical protein LC653_09795 [Nostoc sp. CHAB 5784]|uniref:hypothetical protein n=1 Tax=Nostoc mirabile TaxID=2907820 RepID=UPI001E4CA3AC|nr:hypothetical protein [Nostoc mirabile]MCC5664201.1 hypothetical protein [Nostoc mirabile CHAB5784]
MRLVERYERHPEGKPSGYHREASAPLRLRDLKQLARRREASAPLRLRDLSLARLPESQRERLAPREKELARHGEIRV